MHIDSKYVPFYCVVLMHARKIRSVLGIIAKVRDKGRILQVEMITCALKVITDDVIVIFTWFYSINHIDCKLESPLLNFFDVGGVIPQSSLLGP